jgi:hypothetical protein
VILDGLDVIYAASWPKAIHEGNGTLQLFITKNANEKQRQAIVDILTGKGSRCRYCNADDCGHVGFTICLEQKYDFTTYWVFSKYTFL